VSGEPSNQAVPRRLWFLWLQGVDDAPAIVRRCLDTWRVHNPTWDIVTLDARQLPDWIDAEAFADIQRLRPAHRADAIRLELLAVHGGVWADATTWCVSPLDDWLPDCMASGFFAFHSVGRAFLLSNWFLASEPRNPLVERLRNALLSYWTDNSFPNGYPARALSFALARVLDRRMDTAQWWFSPLVQNGLRLTPYYAFHHKFAQLVATDRVVSEIWRKTTVVTSERAHFLQRCGLTAPLADWSKSEIDAPTSPVYKLTWKIPGGSVPSGSVLDYLFQPADPG
jgi:hypothetical protein